MPARELDDWVLTTAPRAVAYATSLLRDRQRAEDIVQDCYCRLLARAGDYDLPRDGLKLLLKSISNACINVQTRRRWIRLWPPRFERSEPSEIVDRSAREPARLLMDRELEQAIGRGLCRLPERQRAALELRSQGESLQDIGEILGIDANHAGVLVHRARKAMESYLAPFVGESTR